ncbi:HAD family phosphatase [Aerococcaceae bacterium DSM 111176]|nr:HAD family phosphatase [Aerococcaceae bacterium DSM 111176]
MGRMIAIDLDGTLLDDNLMVSQANIDSINKAIQDGFKIVICTGRPYAGMKKFITEFCYSNKHPEYLILGNGTTIRTVNDLEAVHNKTIDQSVRETALTILQQYQDQGLALAALNDFHFYGVTNSQISNILIEDASKNEMTVESLKFDDFLMNDQLNKLMFLADPQLLDSIQEEITEAFSNIADNVRSTSLIFEVLPKDINKGSSLTLLAKHLNIDLQNTTVIGDAPNDITMFEVAGKRVAMENAHETIRQLSDFITLSNNDSGVAAAILHELNGK